MKNLGRYKDNLDIPRKQDIDVVASRVSTNEDNIAMLDSDMKTAQGDILTLKTNVTEVTNALTSKQDKIVGGASTITDDNLTANRALVSNSSGKVAVSAVTSTELGYLDGVTSNVQAQLDSKLSEAPVQSVNSKTGAVTLTKADIGLGNVDNVKQYSANNPPPYPVTSVNKKTGAVVLDASDVNAVAKTGDSMTGTLRVGSASLETNGYVTGTWFKTTANTALSTKPSKIAVINDGWIYSRTPEQIKNDIGLSNVDNVKQYSTSNPPPYPVTSVNGQTGAVTIESDVPENIVRYYDVASTEAVEGINADTLEGHKASYFATASELSTINTTLNSGLSAIDTQVSELNSGLSTANSNISALQTAMNDKVDKSGGTLEGALVAQRNTNYATAQVRNVIISPADPSGGSNGDIWIKYTP